MNSLINFNFSFGKSPEEKSEKPLPNTSQIKVDKSISPSSSNEIKEKRKKFKVAYETRNLEINLFWIRYGAFWIIVAAAFIGFAELYNKQNIFSVFIASVGFISSLAWTLINRGSKYWQETWEDRAGNSDETNFLRTWEPLQQKNIWGARRYSVSKIAIILSDFISLVWIIIFIFDFIDKTYSNMLHTLNRNILIAIAILTVTSTFTLFLGGRTTLRVIEPYKGKEYRLELKWGRYYFSYFDTNGKKQKIKRNKKTEIQKLQNDFPIIEELLKRLPNDKEQI